MIATGDGRNAAQPVSDKNLVGHGAQNRWCLRLNWRWKNIVSRLKILKPVLCSGAWEKVGEGKRGVAFRGERHLNGGVNFQWGRATGLVVL